MSCLFVKLINVNFSCYYNDDEEEEEEKQKQKQKKKKKKKKKACSPKIVNCMCGVEASIWLKTTHTLELVFVLVCSFLCQTEVRVAKQMVLLLFCW